MVVELEVRAPSEQEGHRRFHPPCLHQVDLGLLKPAGACHSVHSEEPSPPEGSSPNLGPAAQSRPAERRLTAHHSHPRAINLIATLHGPDVTSILTALGGVTPRGGPSGHLLWGLCCLQKAHMSWTDQCATPEPSPWLSCVTARQNPPPGRACGCWREEQTKHTRPQTGSPQGQAWQDGPAGPAPSPAAPLLPSTLQLTGRPTGPQAPPAPQPTRTSKTSACDTAAVNWVTFSEQGHAQASRGAAGWGGSAPGRQLSQSSTDHAARAGPRSPTD